MKRPLAIVMILLALAAAPTQAEQMPRAERPVVSKAQRAAAPSRPADAYWYEGRLRRELHIDRDQVAEFADARGAQRGQPLLRKSLGGDPRRPGEKSSPLFRPVGSPAAAARALPGGIVVTLRTPGSAEQANAALAPFGMRVARPVDPSGLRWVVATEAGMAALEKANQLHESGAFASVSPDWWVPITRK